MTLDGYWLEDGGMCLVHLWIYFPTQQIPWWRCPLEMLSSASLWVLQQESVGGSWTWRAVSVPPQGKGMWKREQKLLKAMGKVGRGGADGAFYLFELPRRVGSLWAILAFSAVVKQQACRMAGDEKEAVSEGFKLMSWRGLRWVETPVKPSMWVPRLRAGRHAPGWWPAFPDREPECIF